jgi:hypothetical protein
MKLYELSAKYDELERLFEEGEIDEQTVTDTLEAIDAAFEDKAESIACLVKSKLLVAAAIKEEIQKLKGREQNALHKAEFLKDYLAREMSRAGKTRIETVRADIRTRKAISLNVEDNEMFLLLYPQFERVKIESSVDKAAVTKEIKDGGTFEGAMLTEKTTVQIK